MTNGLSAIRFLGLSSRLSAWSLGEPVCVNERADLSTGRRTRGALAPALAAAVETSAVPASEILNSASTRSPKRGGRPTVPGQIPPGLVSRHGNVLVTTTPRGCLISQFPRPPPTNGRAATAINQRHRFTRRWCRCVSAGRHSASLYSEVCELSVTPRRRPLEGSRWDMAGIATSTARHQTSPARGQRSSPPLPASLGPGRRREWRARVGPDRSEVHQASPCPTTG